MNMRILPSRKKRAAVVLAKPKTSIRGRVRPTPKSAQPRGSAIPARIAHKPAHQHSAARQAHVPGQLVVRCKVDVTDGLPDVRRASIASLHTFALPAVIESPFKK